MVKYLDKPYRYLMSLFKGYHIIVVPKEKGDTKTFKVSGFSLKVLVMSVVLSVPLFLVSLLTTIHYQNKLVSLKRDTYENHKLIQHKKELIAEVAKLEKKLETMDGNLEQISKVMDVDLESMKAGVGPVSDLDLYLPEDEVIHPLDSLQVDSETLIDEWIENNGDLSVDKFSNKLASIKKQSSYLNKKIKSLFEQNKDKIRFVNSSPSAMPVSGWVTSEFGMRKHPISRRMRMHQGMDIASPYGSPIKAPADALVVYAGYHGGHGRVVVLDHGYGITTMYAHASALEVSIGDQVRRGDVIAKVGSSGASTGPHLHYEVRVDGIPTDPMAFIQE